MSYPHVTSWHWLLYSSLEYVNILKKSDLLNLWQPLYTHIWPPKKKMVKEGAHSVLFVRILNDYQEKLFICKVKIRLVLRLSIGVLTAQNWLTWGHHNLMLFWSYSEKCEIILVSPLTLRKDNVMDGDTILEDRGLERHFWPWLKVGSKAQSIERSMRYPR
jgi:hypothetical protein